MNSIFSRLPKELMEHILSFLDEGPNESFLTTAANPELRAFALTNKLGRGAFFRQVAKHTFSQEALENFKDEAAKPLISRVSQLTHGGPPLLGNAVHLVMENLEIAITRYVLEKFQFEDVPPPEYFKTKEIDESIEEAPEKAEDIAIHLVKQLRESLDVDVTARNKLVIRALQRLRSACPYHNMWYIIAGELADQKKIFPVLPFAPDGLLKSLGEDLAESDWCKYADPDAADEDFLAEQDFFSIIEQVTLALPPFKKAVFLQGAASFYKKLLSSGHEFPDLSREFLENRLKSPIFRELVEKAAVE